MRKDEDCTRRHVAEEEREGTRVSDGMGDVSIRDLERIAKDYEGTRARAGITTANRNQQIIEGNRAEGTQSGEVGAEGRERLERRAQGMEQDGGHEQEGERAV